MSPAEWFATHRILGLRHSWESATPCGETPPTPLFTLQLIGTDDQAYESQDGGMAAENLLNTSLIDSHLMREAPWSEGHGAAPGHLGGGMLYYALTHLLCAKRCVCIGSGGGFVPRLMRQAQRDLLRAGVLEEAETHLIDANLPQSGWGSPHWLDDDSFFRRQFPDVTLHLRRSDEALPSFAPGSVDYVHVDGDHSYGGCRRDFELSLPLLTERGVITLHDTSLHEQERSCGVHRVVNELRRSRRIDVIDLPLVGRGVAIVRPRPRQVGRVRRFFSKLKP
ncbi:hypothetical protein K2D_04210 [Planctomycetes bacterium K2D]|uniref:Class I SAM-dependent methyltransferase n=1 Tax=Botrimarina mediterranea TaxID=2528022 RepID=A0A518K3B3_9BACT|nr:hypothetical protein Spa11_04680 [Botrimarina mediterranea]QDV76838.1 hypothetical protein K2D_04210 [Planctomycetes bacterium K2D]